MKTIKKYSVVACVIIAVILLIISLSTYLYANESIRVGLALASCAAALIGIIAGILEFDSGDE